MADDGVELPEALIRIRCEKSDQHGGRSRGRSVGANFMNTKSDTLTTQKQPEVEPEGRKLHCHEGKKRGSRATCVRKPRTTLLHGFGACTPAMPSSPTTGHERGAGSRTQQLRRVTLPWRRWRPGRNDRKRSPRLLHRRRTNLDEDLEPSEAKRNGCPAPAVNNPAKK